MRDYSLKTWVVAGCMALLVPQGALAAGLGRLTLFSALGQPLNAEIELVSVRRGETINARLASQDVYQQVNAQFNPALVGTRITVEKRANGELYLKATTPRPIHEPFVELVVELNSESGRVTRQYTALLDPPGYGRAAAEIPPPAQPRPPAVAASPQPPAAVSALSADATSEPAPPAPAPAATALPAEATAPRRAAAAPAATSKQYGPIKPGETLGRIARIVKPEGATLEQTLVALHRHNPDAFIKKNMNLVKSGKILNVPDANEISALPQPEAVREVKLQVADFNAFRGRLAERVASAPEEGSTTRGRIGSAVTDGASAAPKDTVRLSRGEPAEKGKGGGKGTPEERVRALEEEAIARQKALADATDRISQHEKTIKDMQRLVELKGGPVPAPQKAAETAAKAPEAKSQKPVTVALAPSGDTKAVPPAQSTAAPAEKGVPLETAKVLAEPSKPAQPEPAAAASSEGAKDAAADAKPAAPAEGAKADAAKADPQPAAKSAARPKPAPEPTPAAPNFIDEITSEPLYLAAGAAVVLLGGLGIVAARRRSSKGKGGKLADEEKIAPTLSGPGASAAPAAANASTKKASPGGGATQSTDDNDLDFHAGAPGAKGGPARPAGTPAATPAASPTSTPAAAKPAELKPQEAAKPAAPPQAKPAVPAPSAAPSAAKPADVPQAKPVIPVPPPAASVAKPGDAPQAKPAEIVGSTKPAVPAQPVATPRPPQPAVPDFSLDAPVAPAAAAKPSPRPAAATPEDFKVEPLPGATPVAAPLHAERVSSEPPPRDLDFKLDLDTLEIGGSKPAGPVKDDHWYDVQQKFDLAKAYEEMGDKDGARDILQEVLQEGDKDQQAQANKLLAALT